VIFIQAHARKHSVVRVFAQDGSGLVKTIHARIVPRMLGLAVAL